MLRPAVAATNCARPDASSGLDIGRLESIVQKTFDPATAWPVPTGCPGGGRASTTLAKKRYRQGSRWRRTKTVSARLRPSSKPGGSGIFPRDWFNSRQNVAFSAYIEAVA